MKYTIGTFIFLQIFVWYLKKFLFDDSSPDASERYIWYMGAAAMGCISCALRSPQIRRPYEERDNLFTWAKRRYKEQKDQEPKG